MLAQTSKLRRTKRGGYMLFGRALVTTLSRHDTSLKGGLGNQSIPLSLTRFLQKCYQVRP